MRLWEYIVRIHQGPDLQALVTFYGIVAAALILLLLLWWISRSRREARNAMQTVGFLKDDMKALQGRLDELERRIEDRIDSRASELNARVAKKLDQKGDRLQERVEERASALSERIAGVESRTQKVTEDVERFRERVDEVEARIPNLFDKLDEFQETLSRTFQAEMNSVLNSFDNSLASLLQQMKSDLQLGISRIEGIESMVRSREEAERNLLGPARETTPQTALEEEEGEFAEWEEEAKELEQMAPEEGEEAAEEELEEETEDQLLDAIPVSDEQEEGEEPTESELEFTESEEESGEEEEEA